MDESQPDIEANGAPIEPLSSPVKRATILDQDDEGFCVEYDNTIGTKNTMRLDANTYEDAIVETKSFLGITEDCDENGTVWEIE